MYKCLHRVVLLSASAPIESAEKMEKIDDLPGDDIFIDEDSAAFALVGRGAQAQRFQRYGIRGVPAKLVDVLMPLDGSPAAPIWLEIGEKAGRFDGAWRDRLTLRAVPAAVLRQPIQIGSLLCDGGRVSVGVGDRVLWQREYRLLDHRFDPTDSGRIIMYHASRYYGHLLRSYSDELRALALSFRASEGADKNRAKSRALYDLSRQLGWRKLSKEERARYGLPADHAQWIRDEELVRLLKGGKRDTAYYASLSPARCSHGWTSGEAPDV